MSFIVDDEVLQVIKTRAIQCELEAEAAKEAYREALGKYWRKWLTKELNLDSLRFPIQCLVQGDPARIVEFRVSLHSFNPFIRFVMKTKAGKWGKTQYTIDLPCSIVPTSNE